MTRPARGILSVSIALALAAGMLLAPARAGAAGPASHHSSAPLASQRIDPGELHQLLEEIVVAGAPGAAAWVRDQRGVQQAASGVADLRTGRPMRADLHYRAGSLTKALVATVVLQLVAEGRLSLQDTVARWLPGILPYGDQVTIEQLLRHTSGVPDYTPPGVPFAVWVPAGAIRELDPPGAGRRGGRPATAVPTGHGHLLYQHRLHPAEPDRGGGHRSHARPRA
jgi:D-alanyl-D-alanine carboxypeptidase